MGLAACGGCRKSDPGDAGAAPSAVIAEVVPRCRSDAQHPAILIPGEDVIVGDVAIGPSGLLVGFIRMDGGKHVASVLRASLDLTTSRVIDVGLALGDDPPPSPRWNGAAAYVAFIASRVADGGAKVRALQVSRIDEGAVLPPLATIVQQADESTAFDVAWSEGGVGLAAWDEDAPPKEDASLPRVAERGFVKVRTLAEASPDSGGSGGPAGRIHGRVASPDTSDAEGPRLLARPGGGFWLAWLARRGEEEAYAVEGPGERRAFRWVEAVTLDARGEPAGPVRRVSSEKGRAASFELARSGPDLVVMVQDEAAPSEGAGARIVRHHVADRVDALDLVDGGVGTSLAELVPVAAREHDGGDGARWLAWTDPSERARMTPLGAGLVTAGATTIEPALDGARVLAAAPPDGLYALIGASPSADKDAPGTSRPRPELRRFVCK